MIEVQNNNFYTITEINQFISDIFANVEPLQNIGLVGEISNFKGPNKSGHFYFSLKDDKSVISAIIFKYNALHLNTNFKNGDQVLVIGNISSYPGYGTYQIIIKNIIPYGQGQLLVKREELKKKLYEQGYFDPSHKLPIPQYVTKVAIVTGLNSAASADLKHNLKRRWPLTEILEFNALVQGESAPKDIIRALNEAIEANPQIIIIGRGGGSIDDLSPFDNEELVKTIYDCKIPIISAVGHEINQSFCDLVADIYASTPTGACEYAVLDINEVINDIENLVINIKSSVTTKLNSYQTLISKYLSNKKMNSIDGLFDFYTEKIKNSYENILNKYKNKITNYQNKIQNSLIKVNAQNPLGLLSKGYSLSYKDGKILNSIKDIYINDTLEIEFSDGKVLVEVKEIGKK